MVSTGALRCRTAADGSGRPIAFLVSTTGCARDLRENMGNADYSYAFVLKALEPVLEQFGTVRRVEQPESRLVYLAERAWADGFRPIHLSVQPPQHAYLTPAVPTVMFPFWEFPRIPDREFIHDTRQNWRRMCSHADLVLTACEFTAASIRRAGVTTPVGVVPVPLAPAAFDVPDWDPEGSVTLDCKHLVLCGRVDPRPPGPPPPPPPASWRRRKVEAGYGWMKVRYMKHVRRWISEDGNHHLFCLKNAWLHRMTGPPPKHTLPRAPLTLDGLVYTSIFNISDRRKNIEDMLSAFLLAFHDRPDATLVLKLVTNDEREIKEVHHLLGLFRTPNLSPRCRVVAVTEYLSAAQMNDLMRATTYYINTSKAEGACLPLQQALAAGRPGLAPGHTAMSDYMDDRVGFVLPSHPEPTHWPHDPEHRYETTWNRLVWSELRDRLLESAAVADDLERYRELSAAARERMARLISHEAVAGALRRALRHVPETRPGALDWVA